MKKLFQLRCIAALSIIIPATAVAQQGSLTVSYNTSEKSKDSRSSSETFSLNGTTLNYTVKYSGRRGPTQRDTVRKCTLSTLDVESVHARIKEKKLAVTDSLTLESSKDTGIRVTASIRLNYIYGSNRGRIRINGDPLLLQQQSLYTNALSLVNQLRGLLKKCP